MRVPWWKWPISRSSVFVWAALLTGFVMVLGLCSCRPAGARPAPSGESPPTAESDGGPTAVSVVRKTTAVPIAASPVAQTPPPAAPTPAPSPSAVQPATGSGTGIEGMVTLGPTCAGPDRVQPCSDSPYAGQVSVRDQAGQQVATISTGADGRFRLDLPPGQYTLVPISPRPGLPPFGREQTVTVISGSYSQVTVRFDTGIG